MTLQIIVYSLLALASSFVCEPSRQRQNGSQPSTHFRFNRSVLERKDVYPARDRLTPPNGHIISFTFSRLEWDDTRLHCTWASLPALNVGDRASNFVLKNQDGHEIRFNDQLGDGSPVVFVKHKWTSLHDKRMLKGFCFYKKQFSAQNAIVDPEHPVKALWGIHPVHYGAHDDETPSFGTTFVMVWIT
ncbi:hypothetical protein BLNAU_22539 [Blattamonas nauphoetae]|uniref:Uncharacterized protein n=1 Tax=Blattamonas nauphoetae TaxID=2049346 RepID=A0ABQ9WUZ0_9EUKA|nr:hypothetical protein BLNAU_22539 [Blattamonas nauphoetae]